MLVDKQKQIPNDFNSKLIMQKSSLNMSPANSASCISAITFDDSCNNIMNESCFGGTLFTKTKNERLIEDVSRNVAPRSDNNNKSNAEPFLIRKDHILKSNAMKAPYKKKHIFSYPETSCKIQGIESNDDYIFDGQTESKNKQQINGSLFSRIMQGFEADESKCEVIAKKDRSSIIDDAYVKRTKSEDELNREQVTEKKTIQKIQLAVSPAKQQLRNNNVTGNRLDTIYSTLSEQKDNSVLIQKEKYNLRKKTGSMASTCSFDQHELPNNLLQRDPSSRHKEKSQIYTESYSSSKTINETTQHIDLYYPKEIDNTASIKSDGSELSVKNIDRQWREVRDEITGKFYYYNRKTRQSQWRVPDDAIILPRKRKNNPENSFDISRNIRSGSNVSSLVSQKNMSHSTSFIQPNEDSKYSKLDCSKASNHYDFFHEFNVTEESILEESIDKNETFQNRTSSCKSVLVETIERDKQETSDIIQRCRRLREVLITAPKSPLHKQRDKVGSDKELCVEQEDKILGLKGDLQECVMNTKSLVSDVDTNSVHVVGDESSSRETITNISKVFCVYCGHVFAESHKLGMHIKLCNGYQKLLIDNPEMDFAVQHVMLNTWNRSHPKNINIETEKESDFTSCDYDHFPFTRTPDEELNSNSDLSYRAGTKTNIIHKTRLLSSNSKPAQTVIEKANDVDLSKSLNSFCDEDSFEDVEAMDVTLELEEYDISPIVSKCPFCKKSFEKGNKFSSHLLKCNERKKSKKRMGKSTPSNITKIQSLLTGGGRRLPGYPKLEAKSSQHMINKDIHSIGNRQSSFHGNTRRRLTFE